MPLDGVPYATPFAWGRCGLVLPRYPGTRVAAAFRNGDADDPIDVGALWESGQGPESEPGDWWLILPGDVPRRRRGQHAGRRAAPPEHTGKATNDLIDADGNRVIEVGGLTVRVGRTPAAAGQRPAAATSRLSPIEHADGAPARRSSRRHDRDRGREEPRADRARRRHHASTPTT